LILSGASNGTHLASNLKADTFTLTEDEISILKNFKVKPENYWQERKQLAWN